MLNTVFLTLKWYPNNCCFAVESLCLPPKQKLLQNPENKRTKQGCSCWRPGAKAFPGATPKLSAGSTDCTTEFLSPAVSPTRLWDPQKQQLYLLYIPISRNYHAAWWMMWTELKRNAREGEINDVCQRDARCVSGDKRGKWLIVGCGNQRNKTVGIQNE